MNLVFKTFEGEDYSIPSEQILEIVPFSDALSLPQLKKPFDALMAYQGKIIPLIGPVPTSDQLHKTKGYEGKAWILVCENYGQIIWGLPKFSENTEMRMAA